MNPCNTDSRTVEVSTNHDPRGRLQSSVEGPANLGDRPVQFQMHLLHAEGALRSGTPLPPTGRVALLRGNLFRGILTALLRTA